MKNCVYLLSPQSPVQMMGFVITEEKGGIIVIDGGNAEDAPNLLETLRRITGLQCPRVDAWLFTHAHYDHMNAFLSTMEEAPDSVEVNQIYCHFPPLSYFERNGTEGADGTLRRFLDYSESHPGRVTKVETGDRISVGEASFEVLFTADTSIENNVVNNSSTVYKLYLGGKTVLFLGDLGEEAGDKLLASSRDKLASDYVQMAHHGQRGVKKDFYEAVGAKTCIWCAAAWLYDDDGTHFDTIYTREWMRELGVLRHYVTKDGDQTIVLPE